MIFLASDHGGYKLKQQLITHLESLGLEVTDMGPNKLIQNDDYPDYVIPTIKSLGADEDRAILICRNGVGVSMLANKFSNVRCTLSWSVEHAISSRTDDNTNVLALAADYIDTETAKDVTVEWLSAPFSNKERHIRRLKKVKEINKQ